MKKQFKYGDQKFNLVFAWFPVRVKNETIWFDYYLRVKTWTKELIFDPLTMDSYDGWREETFLIGKK